MIKLIRCNLCGSDKYSLLYKTYSGDIACENDSYKITDHQIAAAVRIVKCNNCGLVYANPRPAAKKLIKTYVEMVDQHYLAEEQGRRMATRPILNMLHRLKARGRLLDIGCATGFLMDEARKLGWEVYGVELSGWAADYAKDKLNLENVFRGVLKKAGYPDSYFDAIVLKDAIEHLTDPRGTLAEIRRILKPKGILLVNTPDSESLISRILKARWWGVKQSHLYYFSRKTLHKMLKACGFIPLITRSSARAFSAGYWLEKFKYYNRAVYGIFAFMLQHKIIRNKLMTVNLGDQIEVYAGKMRRLKYLDELERLPPTGAEKKMKVIVVLPAYNAAKTLKKTVADIPASDVDGIILVDDASRDPTVRVAKSLGLKVFTHKKNLGYGANQKTCYEKALEQGADIVVMVHPDYQYDPKIIPQLIAPIKAGRADAVFGSRMIKGGALEGGMPLWKQNVNIMLTALENVIFNTFLSEYHSGFRAYSAKSLKSVKYALNSNGFIFDMEIITQLIIQGFKIEEIPIRTRYFDEASTIRFWPSILYGLGILKMLMKYIIHTNTPLKFRQFM